MRRKPNAAGWRGAVGTLLPVVVGLGVALAAPAIAAPPTADSWAEWAAQPFRLDPGESVQLRFSFEEIPVRSWRLVVDGAPRRCDLLVTRVQEETSIYWRRGESHHDVTVPWGRGEAIVAVLTAPEGGIFTVRSLGPPQDAVPAPYSYEVNRALESYAAGKRLEAERHCEAALARNPGDGVAQVLLAGFLRERHFYARAAELVEGALATELPPDMRQLAEQLQKELAQLQSPLPPGLQEGLANAESYLANGDAEGALKVADRLLADYGDAQPEALSRVHQLRGRTLHALGRNFEAVDAYTRALTASRSRESEAIIYFHMGRLFLDMENPDQAEGAFSIARRYGLPPGLDLQAAEALGRIAKQK
jgi:hypothetical protein